jgi:hypothetical protein
MSTENQVSPDADTQNPAPELTNETPDVVNPDVEDEQQQPSETPEEEATKALKRMQRRIDKRTADVYRERAEKEQLAQRVAELERRQAKPQDDEPKHEADANVIQTKALTLAQEIAQQQKFQENVTTVLKAGKALPKFDEACNTLNEELPFYERSGKPTPFLAAVLDFDAPAQLLHHLGTNPDLAAELADLTPTRLVRRLDAIERELTEKAKPKTSSAPKPLTAVRGSASTSDLSDDLSPDEWRARREKQLMRR